MTRQLAAVTRAVAGTIADRDREILEAILFSRNHSASALQLKALLRLKSIVQANAAIGRLGKKIHAELGAHPEGLKSGQFAWWTVAATGTKHPTIGFVWTLRPGVAAGLKRAGFMDSGFALAEEIDTVGLIEGAFRRVTVNAYERNPVARERCIKAHGAACAACGMDFGSVYGPHVRGFIHVHHLMPISQIGETYEVDPVKDLRPVCPNCHAVIHLSNPPRTIEQVKAMIAGGTNRTRAANRQGRQR